MPVDQWTWVLYEDSVLFLEAHLDRVAFSSTLGTIQATRALFWSCSSPLLPFPVMCFQDTNLFIHASVRPKFMMVNKLALLLNDASPQLRIIGRQAGKALSVALESSSHSGDEIPGFNFVWHRLLSTVCWVEAIQFAFLPVSEKSD